MSKLRAIATFAAAVLFVKVLLAILLEYRWYFPADFDSSAFLSGRRYSFFGVYRAAFYAHIIGGPIAVVLGVFMMLSGGRPRFRHVHRSAGRLLMLIVLAVVAPSGLVMARQAYAGPIAAYGFASRSPSRRPRVPQRPCTTHAPETFDRISDGQLAVSYCWRRRCYCV